MLIFFCMVVDMACFHPISGWRSSRDVPFRFDSPPVFTGEREWLNSQIEVQKFPCGLCIGCRIDRSKDWSVRCVLEASQHKENCFITLTYDQEHLPAGGSLNFRDLTLFMKRLRKKFSDCKIRYYGVGEYGAKLQRPHFHIILFGFDFPDKRLWSKSLGNYLYRSASLESLWTYGYSTIGSVSLQSCAYVARYIQKKFLGCNKEEVLNHYGDKVPEDSRMSRRPGIASEWFEQYSTDIYPKDFLVVNGKKFKPSKYFDKLYKVNDPEGFYEIKQKRYERLMEHVEENTNERLAVREQCLNARIKKLCRKFEEEGK